jgi:hypothetical protein
MTKAKKKDYFKLPFEVHFNMLYCRRYEFMEAVDQELEPAEGCSVIRKVDLKSYGVTFACNDPSGGKLAYILSGNLDEIIPDWLELVDEEDEEDEEDEDANGQELHRFEVKGNQLILGKELECNEDEDGAFEPAGSAGDFYLAYGFKPAYIVLDADDSRIVVDHEGYLLGEDDSRIDSKPIVTVTDEQADEMDCRGWDYDDVYEEIVKAYRTEYPQN